MDPRQAVAYTDELKPVDSSLQASRTQLTKRDLGTVERADAARGTTATCVAIPLLEEYDGLFPRSGDIPGDATIEMKEGYVRPGSRPGSRTPHDIL